MSLSKQMFQIHLHLLWLLTYCLGFSGYHDFYLLVTFSFHIMLPRRINFFRLILFPPMTWGRNHIIVGLRPAIRFFSKKTPFPLLSPFPRYTSSNTELATLASIFFWALKFHILRTISGSITTSSHKCSNPTHCFGCFLCFWHLEIFSFLQRSSIYLHFKIWYFYISGMCEFVWYVFIHMCVYW